MNDLAVVANVCVVRKGDGFQFAFLIPFENMDFYKDYNGTIVLFLDNKEVPYIPQIALDCKTKRL